MKKNYLYLLMLLPLFSLLQACSDDDDFHPSIIEDKEEAFTELDQWIFDKYIKPHNISVMYRWKEDESNQTLVLVPPKEEKVQPLLELIKTVWIDPYLVTPGRTFFNSYCPKQLMLIGSVGYTDDDNFVLGETEGSYKVTMYDVNRLDPADYGQDSLGLLNMILNVSHNFHHEFVHVLHQKVIYPESFEEISANEYSSTGWKNIVLSNSAFVTQYAGKDADEDFAEMVSYYLILSSSQWNSMIKNGRDEAAVAKLQLKEKIMRQYMKREWKIDIDELRSYIRTGMQKVFNDNYSN